MGAYLNGVKISGEDGKAATVAVGTVTTGAAGSAAKVTNVGTESAAKFDFTIPKGEKGDKGDPGNNGTNGTTPTIKVAAGDNIGSTGTPTVTASTSGTTTTFTFNYLKGATGSGGGNGSNGYPG